jgi:DNA-binding GntR family transcriptional regulator
MTALLPNDRRLLGTQAADMLREAILGGELAQGSRLNEVELAHTLNISRGSLREALRRLEADGLVVSEPNRGSHVVRVTTEDVLDTIRLRELIEPFAAEATMIATRLEAVAGLTAALEEMTDAAGRGEVKQLVDAHTQFHAVFFLGAESPLLARFWPLIEYPVRLYLRANQQSIWRWDTADTNEPLQDLVLAHKKLLDLASRDLVAELRLETQSHIRVNFESLSGSTAPHGPDIQPIAAIR